MKNQIFDQDSFMPNGESKFCFLFGANIKHSLSPEIQTKWFLKHKINSVYMPFETDKKELFLSIVENMLSVENFLGANITLPYKSTILEIEPFLQSKSVQVILSANTLYRNSIGKWCLENTDIHGVRASMQELNPEKVAYDVFVLGGGGAAAAAIYENANNILCNHIYTFTRDPDKTLYKFPFLARQDNISLHTLEELNTDWVMRKLKSQDKLILINSLPLGIQHKELAHGSYANPNNYACSLIEKVQNLNFCYFDMIYSNTEALLLALKKGITALNGSLMLTVQAKESFYLWTGVKVRD